MRKYLRDTEDLRRATKPFLRHNAEGGSADSSSALDLPSIEPHDHDDDLWSGDGRKAHSTIKTSHWFDMSPTYTGLTAQRPLPIPS
ncbi:uncharacterized protein RAG0_09633 [Rhynchosporium agropyri]|uniref:Uncharacterized protein n=1 Tax=Rhynchosporium agropyri TaxID=914238 RepID=A0A1E1KWB6_9HELO|nr:uncharacterized protein RAG0_09633 [Rhynchosporium agropyri]